mgnify:CR=1 FL=1
MQFSTREDIEIPIEQVFAELSKTDVFVRTAIRRGIDVKRVNLGDEYGVGASWDARFVMRGKPRNLTIQLATHDSPNTLAFTGDSQGLTTRLTLDLIALSPRRTRMGVVLNLAPKTLPARLFIQSVKLAKSNLTKRFKLRVAEYAKTLEDRYLRIS